MSQREVFELQYVSNLPQMLSEIDQIKERLSQAATAMVAGGNVPGVGAGGPRANNQDLAGLQLASQMKNLQALGGRVDQVGKQYANEIASITQAFKLSRNASEAFVKYATDFAPRYIQSGARAGQQTDASKREQSELEKAIFRTETGAKLAPQQQQALLERLSAARQSVVEALAREQAGVVKAAQAADKLAEAHQRGATTGPLSPEQLAARLPRDPGNVTTSAAAQAGRQVEQVNERIANILRQREAVNRKTLTDEERNAALTALENKLKGEYDARLAAQTKLESLSAAPLTQGEIAGYQKPLVPVENASRAERAAAAVAVATAEEARIVEQIKAVAQRNLQGDLATEAARAQERSLQQQLTSVMERRVQAENRLAAESSGIRAQFARGFRGTADVPYAQQLGQAVKFSAFYGTAYRLQAGILQTFQQAYQEGVAFEQGLSDLSIATGQSKDAVKDLANQLMATAADTGANPSQGLEVGSRAIGLYGLAGSKDIAQQSYVAELSNRIVGQLAVGGKAQPVDIQSNLAAITQALGAGAGGQIRVADLDAYFTKRFGAPGGGTLEAGAQSASVGVAAGFSIEQIQAMAALLEGRTGQTPSAVGGYLAQLFSRGGEGSFSQVAQKYGIRTDNQNLATTFGQLAKVYNDPNTTDSARGEISAAAGRGKVQNAIVALLQSFPEIQNQVKGAQSGDASGAQEKQFNERINNIGGQVAVLGAHLKEAAALFAQGGFLSALGLAVEILDKFVTTLNSVLSLFAALPGPIKTLIGVLLAARLAGAVGIGSSVLGGAASGGLARALTPAGIGAIGTRVASIGASLVSPAGLAVGGLLAVAALRDNAMKVQKAMDDSAAALKGAPDAGSTAQQYATYAATLKDQARQDFKTGNPVRQFFSGGVDVDAEGRQLQGRAERALALSKLLAEQEAKAAGTGTAQFAAFDDDGLKKGLDAVTASGGTAATRLEQLDKVLLGIAASGGAAAEAEKRKAERIDPEDYASLGIAGDKITQNLKGFSFYDENAQAYGTGGVSMNVPTYVDVDQKKLRNLASSQINDKDISDILQQQFEASGITKFSEITPAIAKEAADKVAERLHGGKGVPDGAIATLRETYSKALQEQLLASVKSVQEQVFGKSSLTGIEATAVFTQLPTEVQGSLGTKQTNDYAGRAKVLRQALRTARHAASITDPDSKDLPIISQSINQIEDLAVQNQVDRLENLRKVAVANAKTQKAATAAGQLSVIKQIQAVVNGSGGRDILISILSTASQATINIVKKSLQDQLAVAQSAYAAASFVQSLNYNPAAAAAAGKKIKDLEDLINAIPLAVPDSSPDQIPSAPSATEAKDTKEQIAAARRAAAAARNGDVVRVARAALASAAADLHAAKKGTVEYYNALASFYQAQDALSDAIRESAHIRNLLNIDQTDPVEVSALAVQEARKKLRSDRRRGKGGSVINQDKLDLRDAQTQLEADKFSQRLDDVQTADQLGRITHSAYIRYLENEHNRLSAIKNRTRQQQDELNQIDQLMQEATKSMQGAWNIGDIKLPTPYEVRRQIQAQAAGVSAGINARSSSSSQTTIYIDGADVGKVKQIITDVVGQGSRVMTTSPRRT